MEYVSVYRRLKFRPILERVSQECVKLEEQKNIAVNKQMIPVTGTCRLNQYINEKPNPRDYKIVCVPLQKDLRYILKFIKTNKYFLMKITSG